jgi:CheY-like chemotaxis protein
MMILPTNKDLFVSENPQGGYLTSTFAEDYPLTILVAEDNDVNQKLIERILQKLGYKTDIVPDGTKVLTSMAKKDYDVILMDVRMPEMDGFETTIAIRKMAIAQPYIVAMTANAMSSDKVECLHNGMNDYIAKPLSTIELTNALKNAAAYHKENHNLQTK